MELGQGRFVTNKTDFSEHEWARIVRAHDGGLAISLTDPGGPFEATDETMGTLKSATNPPSRAQLLADVALEFQALAASRGTNSIKGYKPIKQCPVGERVLDELRGAQAVVAAKADPNEAAGSGQWPVTAAQAPPRPRRTAASWEMGRTE